MVYANRSAAAALAGCLTLAAGLVLPQGFAAAQQAAPAAPAPGGQPPAAAGQPAGQPQGPVKIALQATQSEWTKVCGNAGPNKQICFTTRDFTQSPEQPPLVALAVYDVKGEDPVVRFLMPPGLLIRPGVRFQAEKGPVQDAAYTICLPNGCFAENKVKAAVLDGMKKTGTLNVVAKNSVNAEVTFAVPMAGFAKAFDGPAIDPKVLQAQQEQQQQELQKQLEARAKAQREQLEKGGAAQPAPAAPAAPAPAPAQ